MRHGLPHLATHASHSKHHDYHRTALHNQIVHGGNSVFSLVSAAVKQI
jgi:hypothetical protein